MAKPDTFRVRLNCVDHYQSTVSSLDPPLWGPRTLSSQRNLPQVPVIRVFGATETGQKVCAHIHGAIPYLFIPYTESIDRHKVENYINTLRLSIDHALALSYRRNPYDTKAAQYVAHMSLVKGVPFFGYNVGYQYYLKIYLLNPLHMTRLTDLLQQGAILSRAFQPYEAHLQYLLQWMCDFNLYGCAYIETQKPHFRAPVPEWAELNDLAHLWHDRSIPPEKILPEDAFPRQSHCQLELDICVHDILSRHEIRPRELHHSFIERLQSFSDLPPEEKLVHSMAGLWKDETRRRKLRMGLTDPSSSPFPPEVLVSMSADPRNVGEGGWIHEEEYRQMVEELARAEPRFESFEDFTRAMTENDGVKTVLESVEDIFPETLRKSWSAARLEAGLDNGDEFEANTEVEGTRAEEPLVDVSSIAQAEEEEEAYESDEEKAKEIALTQTQILRDGAGVCKQGIKAFEYGIKRHLDGDETATKRQKLDANAERPPSRHVAFKFKDARPRLCLRNVDYSVDELPPAAQPPPSAQPFSSPRTNGVHDALSQSSQSSQRNRLNFPVVKDPNDPETQLRLSQRSDVSGSQKAKSVDMWSTSVNSPVRLNGIQSSDESSKTVTPSKANRPRVSTKLADNYIVSFDPPLERDIFLFNLPPPTAEEVADAMINLSVPPVIYQDAYYSNEKDVPERPREYAGQEFKLESTTVLFLPAFDRTGSSAASRGRKVPMVLDKAKDELSNARRRRQSTQKAWEIMQSTPTFDEVQHWLDDQKPALDNAADEEKSSQLPTSQVKRKNRPAPEYADMSQIDGPTQKNRHGFKYSQKEASTRVQHETQYMSTMALEVHVNSRGDLAPDPESDEVAIVVWRIDDEQIEDHEGPRMGIVLLARKQDALADKIRKIVGADVQVDEQDDELDLINRMVDIVRSHDPDILTGYEVHNSSWGYLIERSRLKYEFDLPDEFSRMKSQSHGRFGKDADRWGFTHTSTVRITGRHTINIWRAMRSELNLRQYTMENVAFHLIHRRIPHYSFATLTRWYTSKRPRDLAKVLQYFISRVKLDIEILNANELIPRTSEQARLLGVDFFSVFSRGSQFKVESLMFRIAKPESFVLVSPSRKQVGAQNALECLPLVMEPQSAFYNSPLLVLDFQSLYPSVMIAYNYCYSTCLGRITNWRGTNKMGFSDFKRSPGLLRLVKDKINVSPNGMMFVRPEMRKSLLAKMLGEILETRVMVKSGMKVDRQDRMLQQLLNNRQLALKLIANVTYGYTTASFSGRMPCSEIADAIVQTGRETLEKAIALIHSVDRWGAEVVYGDTDSLFVYLKGRTKDDAFRIGDEIAKAVTDLSPRPIKLKFEKVYHPCVLLAKKRYVGFKYESPSQTEPEFDAKGIETVRRDGTPAEQKIEEKALKLLFRTADLSQVKSYVQDQCRKIMQGRFSVQDFCFAKEVKLGTYAEKGPPPPGARIATKRMLRDSRQEPQYGERVPYVVIAGAPGARLFERCVEPERLVFDERAELDAEYYISKNLIPPLERIFNLVGANVRSWYDEMPKVQRVRLLGGRLEQNGNGNVSKRTMESYMATSACLVCRTKLPPAPPGAIEAPLPLCAACNAHPQRTLLALRGKVQKAERKARDVEDVCRSCADVAWDDEVKCDSRDCPVFYTRAKAKTRLGSVRGGLETVIGALEEREGRREELEW